MSLKYDLLPFYVLVYKHRLDPIRTNPMNVVVIYLTHLWTFQSLIFKVRKIQLSAKCIQAKHTYPQYYSRCPCLLQMRSYNIEHTNSHLTESWTKKLANYKDFWHFRSIHVRRTTTFRFRILSNTLCYAHSHIVNSLRVRLICSRT